METEIATETETGTEAEIATETETCTWTGTGTWARWQRQGGVAGKDCAAERPTDFGWGPVFEPTGYAQTYRVCVVQSM